MEEVPSWKKQLSFRGQPYRYVQHQNGVMGHFQVPCALSVVIHQYGACLQGLVRRARGQVSTSKLSMLLLSSWMFRPSHVSTCRSATDISPCKNNLNVCTMPRQQYLFYVCVLLRVPHPRYCHALRPLPLPALPHGALNKNR